MNAIEVENPDSRVDKRRRSEIALADAVRE